MSQHLSKETWNILESKRGSLLHIETSAESEAAGRHICSINKRDIRVAELISVAPELLDMAYLIDEGRTSYTEILSMARSLIRRSHESAPTKIKLKPGDR